MSLHTTLCFILLALASITPVDPAQAPEQLYRKGVDELAQGRTEKAIIIFESILAQGYESAALYNNLGTSYLREDKIGSAVLNYEKALLISPRNILIQKNALAAKSKTRLKAEQHPFFFPNHFSESLLFAFTLDELAVIAIVLLVLSLCLMALHLHVDRTSIKLISQGIIIAAIFTLSVASLQLYFHNITSRAVVVQQEVKVKNAASLQAKDAFSLYEGAIVNIQDNFEGWYKISWADDKKGWVQMNSLEKIKTP